MVTIQIEFDAPGIAESTHAQRLFDTAFDVIAHIGRVMSAHLDDSDLAAIARGAGSLTVDSHTVAVLRLAQYWSAASAGAFDPAAAGARLYQAGLRPGLRGIAASDAATSRGAIATIRIVSPTTIEIAQPLKLDFGGIAKGYAVDRAIDALRALGVTSALVDAGGDMRAIGPRRWPVRVHHAGAALRDRPQRFIRYLADAALATSVSAPMNIEFVARRYRLRGAAGGTRSCTVHAPVCVDADALTKWALQTAPRSPRLRAVAQRHRAKIWTS